MSIQREIAEVKDEIKMRKQVYRGLVSRRKMSHDKAKYKIETMEMVLSRLLQIQQEPRHATERRTDSREPDH